MADAQPENTRKLVGILRAMGEDDLAEQLPEQPYHGRCTCTSGCAFVLTAPVGSSGTFMLWLELDGEILGQVSLDPDGRMITSFEIDLQPES